MSWRDRLAGWIAPRQPAEAGALPAPVQDAGHYALPDIRPGSQAWDDLFGAAPLVPVPTEQSALTLSAVYACVNLIAGAVASLIKHVYRVNVADGEKDRILNDKLWWVLNEEFCPRWSAASAWEFLMQSLLLHGDGFAVIERDAVSMPIGLRPAHPLATEVLINVGRDPSQDRLVYAITDPQPDASGTLRRRIYDQDDVIHIAGLGFNGVRGLSMLRFALRNSAAVALAAQDFSAAFFANSARPDYALKTDGNLTTEQIENLREQMATRHQGVANGWRPMVLQGGLDLKTVTMPLEDTQLLEVRKFQVDDIARAFGVPPFMIGSTEKTTSWGSGVEAMGTGFVRFALRQHLNKIEAELNRKLFRTASKRVEFDTFDLERADMLTMFNAFKTALGGQGLPGFMTAEEVRLRLSMKAKPASGTLNVGATNAPPQPAQPAA